MQVINLFCGIFSHVTKQLIALILIDSVAEWLRRSGSNHVQSPRGSESRR